MNLTIFCGWIIACISIQHINSFEFPEHQKFYRHPSGNKRCQMGIKKSLLSANCTLAKYEEVPQNLRKDIQILDLAWNRLSTLTKNSFSRYTSLQFLGLGDNFLLNIEEDAFEPLQQLLVLSLTKTRSSTLPKNLFTLPNLKNLHLEANLLTDSVFETKITAPLTFLHVSKNKLAKIPHFGPFPDLVHLNLSENSISKISVADIAQYCKLQSLDVTGNLISFDSSNCDCQSFKFWAEENYICVRPTFKCEESRDANCYPIKISNRTMNLFKDCEETIRRRIENEYVRSTWTSVGSFVSGFGSMVFISLVLHSFLKYKRNRAARNADAKLIGVTSKEAT